MRKFSRFAAVMAGLLLVTAGSQAVLANCTQNAAVFPVFQCGFGAWFAPAPAGSGPISASWWQLGYGNKAIAEGIGGVASEGTGIAPAGVFSGNDNGLFQIVLADAASVLPGVSGIPAGALCSNYENSWGASGVDGCVDNPRTTSAYDNDNVLNRYFDVNGPGFYSTNYQIDYPMAMLLTEGSNRFFSVAFVASKSRGTTQAERANDIGAGVFDLGTINNGEANPAFPGALNQIPWQAIPKQNVDAVTFSNPADKQNSDRQLALSWPAVQAVSDGSVRPSGRALNNPGNGVGVLDQGPVVRYVIETAPITSSNPDPSLLTWSAAAETTGNTAVVTVPPDTAIRLRTLFGKKPSASSESLANCRLGTCGDKGYDVVSGLTVIAGPLVAERVADLSAIKEKNSVAVTFRTTSELTVSGISVLAISGKGETVLTTVTPKQGTTGVGADYSVNLSVSDLKGAKQIAVRLEGTGGSLIHKSDPVSIR